MTVKAKVGRKRYVVFKLDSPREVARGELIHAFNKLPSKPYLIILEPNGGIVRYTHSKQARTLEDLEGTHRVGRDEVSIGTVRVAGSIKKAKKILANI